MPTPANSLNIQTAGFVTFNGTATFNGRTLTAGSGISISNGNGVSGDPIISSTLTFPLATSLGGTGASNTPTSGTLLRGNGSAFVPTTATYPATAGTSGNVLTSNGTNFVSQAPASSVSGPGSSTDRAISTWNGTAGAALFNNSTVKIDSTGRMTNTTQPAFSAFLATTAFNKTGNGGVYTLGTDALTEVFDQGSDFNTNGTFTAPVTGKYWLKGQATISGTTLMTTGDLQIVTSNRIYDLSQYTKVAPNFYAFQNSVLADMDNADVATVTISASGEAADNDDVFGGSPTFYTFFMGQLTC